MWTYLVENYPQKPCEVWLGDRRVVRRVSPAHDRRLKNSNSISNFLITANDPFISEWSLYNIVKRSGFIPDSEFRIFRESAEIIYSHLVQRFSRHPIWLRGENHPAAPAVVDQIITFSFHPSGDYPAGAWYGGALAQAWSRANDGPDILQDIVSVLKESFRTAQLLSSDVVELEIRQIHDITSCLDGIYWRGGISIDWQVRKPVKHSPFCLASSTC